MDNNEPILIGKNSFTEEDIARRIFELAQEKEKVSAIVNYYDSLNPEFVRGCAREAASCLIKDVALTNLQALGVLVLLTAQTE